MSVVLIQLQDQKQDDSQAPICCPRCGSTLIARWGQAARNIYDTEPVQAVIERFHCEECHYTFRYYPKGVDRSQFSERIRRLAALIWLMDLSVRDVVEVFQELGVNINRMTIWREGQKLIEKLNAVKALDPANRYSIDKTIGLQNRSQMGVVLVLSLEAGRTAVLGTLDASNPALIIEWLNKILYDCDIQAILMETRELVLQGPVIDVDIAQEFQLRNQI